MTLSLGTEEMQARTESTRPRPTEDRALVYPRSPYSLNSLDMALDQALDQDIDSAGFSDLWSPSIAVKTVMASHHRRRRRACGLHTQIHLAPVAHSSDLAWGNGF